MGYPLELPLSLLEQQQNVVSAKRCFYRQTETRQVLLTVRGSIPEEIDLKKTLVPSKPAVMSQNRSDASCVNALDTTKKNAKPLQDAPSVLQSMKQAIVYKNYKQEFQSTPNAQTATTSTMLGIHDAHKEWQNYKSHQAKSPPTRMAPLPTNQAITPSLNQDTTKFQSNHSHASSSQC